MAKPVKVPATRQALKTRLTTVARDLALNGWVLAAFVYAWTEPQQGARSSVNSDGRYSFQSFADLGIRGLRSVNTVKRHRRIWEAAIDAGYVSAVGPGEDMAQYLQDLDEVDYTEFVAGLSASPEKPVAESSENPEGDDTPEPENEPQDETEAPEKRIEDDAVTALKRLHDIRDVVGYGDDQATKDVAVAFLRQVIEKATGLVADIEGLPEKERPNLRVAS